MRISLNWINDYVDIKGIDPKWLIDKITVTTAEVEEIIYKGEEVKNVVVGQIVEIKPHPANEKLKIIKVSTGDETIQSVCGAPNIYEGMLLPFAKLGGSLPEIDKIASSRIHGIESNGVACSEKEIGISNNHEGVLDLTNMAEIGQPIEEVIPLKDIIFLIDNKSLTNRPDLWCHHGIAREIAAITGRKLKAVDCLNEEQLRSISGDKLDVSIEPVDKVLRYSAIAVSNINRVKSPVNISTRVYYCGLKPISFIVDLSNYVMLDVGQPLHTFDRSAMPNIRVSTSKENESFTTLDDVNRKLPSNTLMIGNKDKYTAIAGIMGGKASEIKASTKDILLESADFDGVSIRKASSALGLRTDASIRYEKFLDSSLTLTALGRFLKLLLKYDEKAEISSSLFDKVIKATAPIDIKIEHSYIETYLGNKITDDEVLNILKAIEFQAVKTGDTYNIKVPTFRATKDVTSKADIVEEILRFYGYDRINSIPFRMDINPVIQNSLKDTEAIIKDILAKEFSFNEVHSYSWYDSEWIKRINYKPQDNLKIVNSNITQFSILRDNLMPNLLQIAHENRKEYDSFKIFEIGRPYIRKEEGCHQPKHLSVLIYKNSEEEIKSSFFHLKGICNSIFKIIKNIPAEYKLNENVSNIISQGKQLDIYYKDICLGYIGVVKKEISKLFGDKSSIAVMDMNLETFYSINKNEVVYEPVSKYPETYLDFSFLVNSTMPYETFSGLMHGYEHNHILSIDYVDCYEGINVPAEMKSITVRMRIGDKNKTLEFKEIEDIRSEFINYMDEQKIRIR